MTHTHTRTETYEERFLRLIGEARDYGLQNLGRPRPGGQGNSREASLALTKLDEAEMWAARDIKKKEMA